MREYVCFHLLDKKDEPKWELFGKSVLWHSVLEHTSDVMYVQEWSAVISLNLTHWSLTVLIFSFFFAVLCNLLRDFLVSSQSLAISSSNCSSGRVDGMQWEILLLMAQKWYNLSLYFSPTCEGIFPLEELFCPPTCTTEARDNCRFAVITDDGVTWWK